MNRHQHLALTAFGIGLIGLGTLALIYGDFALVWQPVAAWVPARTALAYASGLLMLLCGAGLLLRASASWSARILFPYLLAWLLLKVPALIAAPRMEAVWLGAGEIAVPFAAGWVLFASLSGFRQPSIWDFATGERGIRNATLLFGISLIPIGLSHIVYPKATVDLVPAWLPFRTAWAYLTGVGQIACGLGVLFSIYPRVAAMAEAAMVSSFALLVWAPAVLAAPKARLPWTAFLITWFFAASAWVVASNIVPARKTVADDGRERQLSRDAAS